MTPNEIEMNERKAIINQIIIDGENNPDIDINKILDMFRVFNIELGIYKYAGIADKFHTELTNELNTNTNGLKTFLEQVLVNYQITIYQYLISTIK